MNEKTYLAIYLIVGLILGALLMLGIVSSIRSKKKNDLSAMICLSMLGVTLFKVDLADRQTIQSTFDGLIGISNIVLGKRETNKLIDTVANSIEDIMKGDPEYGSNDNER